MQFARTAHIPTGSTYSIITYLNENGLNLNLFDFITIKLLGNPQSGWINFSKVNNSKLDFLYKLTNSKAAMEQITLIPGETYYYFLKEVAHKLQLSETELFRQYFLHAKRKDGNILAETYNLPVGMPEAMVIKHFTNYTHKKYKEFSEKVFGDYHEQKWFSYVTVASIVQKEAANIKEMPIVASVIYNRLSKNMRLQMDGSLNYGQFSHNKVTAKMIQFDESSYNTYKKNGIPKDPVCGVSMDAIKAAIFPAVTPYLYFVRNRQTNTHAFTQDYNNHKNNINSTKINETKSVDQFPTKKIDLKAIWAQ